ncbi:MAG: PKD domain-containing protein [Methanosarcina sp.]|nr:PKD domain-containing protein [Methanosarcina sp.]MDW5558423.1 PKD domain-containing protein [Methanosarcina sp.]
MLKQQFNEVKKLLIVSLAVFFVATLTITTASAATGNVITYTELQKSSTNSQATTGSVVEVTQLGQINAALEKGPVLLKFGADWCESCNEMKPILQALATEYKGKATIMSVDIDKSPELASYFGAGDVIPDSTVIVMNSKYSYMQENGEVTKDRSTARIIGLTDKQELENVLDLALSSTNAQNTDDENTLDEEDTDVQNTNDENTLDEEDTDVQNTDDENTLDEEDTDVQNTDEDTNVLVAQFTSAVTKGSSPLCVKFTDTSTGEPTKWKWDLGDGTTSSKQNPKHEYSKAGSYTVKLTVTNNEGSDTVARTNYIVVTKPAAVSSNTDEDNVEYVDEDNVQYIDEDNIQYIYEDTNALVAQFTSDVTKGSGPLCVKFTDTSTGEPTKWKWDFGDGTTSSKQNPKHEYSKAGSYTVKLTVTNDEGSDTVTRTSYVVVTKKNCNCRWK